MSSSGVKLQKEGEGNFAAEAAPFCYAEAEGEGGKPAASAAQAVEERVHRAEKDAFERGKQVAEQQLRGSAETAVAESRERVRRALEEFAHERTEYYRRVEIEVVQLALGIARKILHREAQIDPNLLAGIVRVTLEKLDSATKVNLYVNPREGTDWRHYFARQMEGAPAPEIHDDGTLAPGECRMETSLGTAEIGLELQLKEIETGLLDLLAERPQSETGGTSSGTLPGTLPSTSSGTHPSTSSGTHPAASGGKKG
jgi:flagellar assembly protein FliH